MPVACGLIEGMAPGQDFDILSAVALVRGSIIDAAIRVLMGVPLDKGMTCTVWPLIELPLSPWGTSAWSMQPSGQTVGWISSMECTARSVSWTSYPTILLRYRKKNRHRTSLGSQVMSPHQTVLGASVRCVAGARAGPGLCGP